VSQKNVATHGSNCVNPLPIFTIISPLESALNFQQNKYNIFRQTLCCCTTLKN